MEVFLLILAIVVLASLQYEVDLTYLNRDYQEWKHRRR
jgi:hypothetical protein